MRYLFIFLASILFISAKSQDKALLKKQLMQLLIAYPNKFRDIKSDGFTYDFNLTGSVKAATKQLRNDTSTVSMAIRLSKGSTEAEANSMFDKWSNLFDATDFNGAKMVSKDLKGDGKLYLKSRVWKLDNSSNRIDAKYANFSITLEIMKIGQTYFSNLSIGDE